MMWGAWLTQTETIVGDRAHALAEPFEVGKKVLPEAQQDLVAMPLEGEAVRLTFFLVRLLHLQPGLQLYRRPSLDEVGQLRKERVRRLGTRPVSFAEREHFLELIEDEERSQDLVPGTPEITIFPVQELPQRFLGLRPRGLHVGSLGLLQDRGLDLRREIGLVLREVEPNVDRQNVLTSKQGKEPCLEERGLPQSRGREKDREPLAFDPTVQHLGFELPATEVLPIGLGERDQPGPGVLVAEPDAGWEAREFGVHAKLALR